MLLCISSLHCLWGLSVQWCVACVCLFSLLCHSPVNMAALLCSQLLAGMRVAPGPAILRCCCCILLWSSPGMSVLISVVSASLHLGMGSCVSCLHSVGHDVWGNDGGCQNEVGDWRVCWDDQHPESRDHIIEMVPSKAFPVYGVSHVGSLQDTVDESRKSSLGL